MTMMNDDGNVNKIIMPLAPKKGRERRGNGTE